MHLSPKAPTYMSVNKKKLIKKKFFSLRICKMAIEWHEREHEDDDQELWDHPKILGISSRMWPNKIL
jgi:hypothetical protein